MLAVRDEERLAVAGDYSVMALVNAGLRLDAFLDSPEPALYSGLGRTAGCLPACYVVTATKP